MTAKKSYIIALVTLVPVTALAAFSFVTGLKLSADGAAAIPEALALTFIALLSWYLVHNVLHEAGHAVAAKINGAKILEFSVFFLDFYRVGNKTKFKISVKSAYAGWVSFVCADPDSSEKTLRSSLIGGLIGTLATFVIIGVTFAIFRTFTAYYLVVMGAFSVAYMAVINYVCRFYGTDGALLFDEKGRSAAFKRSARILKAESAMYLGRRLSEVVGGSVPETELIYYDLLAELSNGRTAVAEDVANSLEKMQNMSDNELIAVLFEKFFIACILNDEEKIARLKDDFLYAEGSLPAALRAHAKYRYLTGETEWAKSLEKSYLRSLEDLPLSGYVLTERAVYERYFDGDARF